MTVRLFLRAKTAEGTHLVNARYPYSAPQQTNRQRQQTGKSERMRRERELPPPVLSCFYFHVIKDNLNRKQSVTLDFV